MFVIVAALVGATTIASPAAAQTVVLTSDFEDGTTQSWAPSAGQAGLNTVNSTAAAHTGTHSLLTTGRTISWQGPNRSMTGLVPARVKFSYSLFARMVTGATANLHLTTMPNFVWTSPAMSVTAASWVELRGTYTSPVDVELLYVESIENVGDFYIDDFTLTRLPPAAAVITGPTEGTVTVDRRPVLTGTSDPLNSITVTRGGTTVCTATADANGNWSCTPTVDLIEGPNYLMPTARDGINVATPGYPVTVVVDTTAPVAPAVTSPANGAALAASPPTISGTGGAFTTVTVAEGGTTICTATVDGNGRWSCRPAAALTSGSHTLTSTAVDKAGNTTVGASTTFTIDTTPPVAPTIASPASGSLTNDATPTISGSGETGTTITMLENRTSVCTATVAAGTWTCTPATPLPDGIHRLTAIATDAAGNTTIGASTTFTVDTTPPVVPVITSPTQGQVIGDATPTFAGTGETGSTITILEGATPICTVLIEVCGHWTCTPTNPLTVGDHTLIPRADDPAGNSSLGAPVTITVTPTVAAGQVVGRTPRCPVPM
ncbi:Ig-like domain-containing protein [Luedemannella flava]|uniref:Ig-like domain-containing protein n=1 Tax=Luedemannella flava TaxID=349316 RepID=UPI0031DA5F93